MLVWSVIWIGFLGVIAWAAIQWMRGGTPNPNNADGPEKTARATLDNRLASGEIDIDEYQKRRAAIEEHRPSPAG